MKLLPGARAAAWQKFMAAALNAEAQAESAHRGHMASCAEAAAKLADYAVAEFERRFVSDAHMPHDVADFALIGVREGESDGDAD